MKRLTKRPAGVALGFCLGLRGPGGRGCLELGEISPFGHSEVPPVDFKKSRSATCKGKPTPEGEEPRTCWRCLSVLPAWPLDSA